MYIKLMIRGLARHRKKGKRLFLLLALCSTAVIFLLTFRNEFSRQYRELFIGTTTGHLQILPPEAQAFSTAAFTGGKEQLPLFSLEQDLKDFVTAQPEVLTASGILQVGGSSFNLDSEGEDYLSLVALDPETRSVLFPLSPVLEGSGDIRWSPEDREVPVLRNRLYTEFGQENPDHSQFGLYDLKMEESEIPGFGKQLAQDFPKVFPQDWNKVLPSPPRVLEFLSGLLTRAELYRELEADRREPYDYKVDDAVVALREKSESGRTSFLNKRLFQALYPEKISPVWEPVVPGKSVTLQLPPAKTQGVISSPVVMPARYTGLVDFMPLYSAQSFLDLSALQFYMDLSPDQVMSYTIRLRNTSDTPEVKARIEQWLSERGSRLKVADYTFLGSLYQATSTAMEVVVGLLVGIFMVILVIFVVNLVLLSVIQRRKEIGTSLALGLSGRENSLLMTGEVLVIVLVSWTAGALLATALVAASGVWGLPGMIFFPGGRIHLDLFLPAYGISLGLFLLCSSISAWLPLSGLRKLLPVELLKEAS